MAAARRRVRPRPLPQSGAPEPARHFVVCGDDALAQRVVVELTRTNRYPVTVILPSRHRNYGPQLARLPGVRIIEAERLGAEVFVRARVATARALALLKQDDVGNMDAALLAQELNPELRLVVRMFNMNLGHHVRVLLRDCRVLSDASIAAPTFVAAALGEIAPSYIRLPGQTLCVARGADLRLSGPEQVMQAFATLTGVALVPVVTAAVVEAVVNARLALALGSSRGPEAGHVVVVGLGNLGTRVIQQLHDLGVPVVAIDKTES